MTFAEIICGVYTLQVTLFKLPEGRQLIQTGPTELKAATIEIPFLHPEYLQLEINHDQFHN